MQRKCRSCSSRRAPANGMIRRNFPGPWVGNPTTRAKLAFTRGTFSAQSPMPKSQCCTRMTIPAPMIVVEEGYETSEPTIDSHIVKMKSLGADTLVSFATPKFAAQSIKKIAELGWKPLHVLTNVSTSIGSVMKPAGLENAQDIVSATFMKDITDARWNDDPGIKRFTHFLDKYYPKANRSDWSVLVGYSLAQTLTFVLKNCGDDLTRQNVMKQA